METLQASGSFEVRLKTDSVSTVAHKSGITRMSLEKRYHGGLDGTADGEMLAYRTQTAGSAGYVAMERVAATLGGRRGGFVLQHSSTMNQGAATQSISVVPDSGYGGLTGISGSMVISVTEGQHSYQFDFTLP